jgi:hypothetical protein
MGDRTFSFSNQTLSDGEKLAVESKQTTANNALADIAADIKPLSGASAAGTLALAAGDTWYTVPSSVPASDYVLVVSKENSAGTIRWAFANTSSPSATYGNKLMIDDIIAELAAGQVIYIASSTAGDDVNWTTKII